MPRDYQLRDKYLIQRGIKLTTFVFFIEVLKHKSYTKAAEALGVSKVLISKEIKALEEALGVKLLMRTTRRIEITPAGIKFGQYACSLTDLWNQGVPEILGAGDTGVAASWVANLSRAEVLMAREILQKSASWNTDLMPPNRATLAAVSRYMLCHGIIADNEFRSLFLHSVTKSKLTLVINQCTQKLLEVSAKDDIKAGLWDRGMRRNLAQAISGYLKTVAEG